MPRGHFTFILPKVDNTECSVSVGVFGEKGWPDSSRVNPRAVGCMISPLKLEIGQLQRVPARPENV